MIDHGDPYYINDKSQHRSFSDRHNRSSLESQFFLVHLNKLNEISQHGLFNSQNFFTLS